MPIIRSSFIIVYSGVCGVYPSFSGPIYTTEERKNPGSIDFHRIIGDWTQEGPEDKTSPSVIWASRSPKMG